MILFLLGLLKLFVAGVYVGKLPRLICLLLDILGDLPLLFVMFCFGVNLLFMLDWMLSYWITLRMLLFIWLLLSFWIKLVFVFVLLVCFVLNFVCLIDFDLFLIFGFGVLLCILICLFSFVLILVIFVVFWFDTFGFCFKRSLYVFNLL